MDIDKFAVSYFNTQITLTRLNNSILIDKIVKLEFQRDNNPTITENSRRPHMGLQHSEQIPQRRASASHV